MQDSDPFRLGVLLGIDTIKTTGGVFSLCIASFNLHSSRLGWLNTHAVCQALHLHSYNHTLGSPVQQVLLNIYIIIFGSAIADAVIQCKLQGYNSKVVLNSYITRITNSQQ